MSAYTIEMTEEQHHRFLDALTAAHEAIELTIAVAVDNERMSEVDEWEKRASELDQLRDLLGEAWPHPTYPRDE